MSDASHELKTPLAAIRLLTDSILQTENIDPDTTREFVADIGAEAERLSRITEDLLRLTRLDSGVLDPPVRVAVLPVLEQVMRMMCLVAQEKRVDLTYEASGECTVLATRDEIHQVIYNLTDNGVKYTGAGGAVQLSLIHIYGAQLDMRNDLPAEVIQNPLTVNEAHMCALKARLARNVGNFIVATFLVGTQGTVSWECILYDVGNDYVTIYQAGRDRYIVSDIYSLKYIEFYDTERRAVCEELLRENGWQRRQG